MADKPKAASPRRLSNIMGLLRGNFDFNQPDKSQATLLVNDSTHLISRETKNKIINNAIRATDPRDNRRLDQSSILGIVQSSLSKVGAERLENRKILQLMPNVRRAASLMVASIFSPNDLSRQNIKIIFDRDDITDNLLDQISDFATDFFQKKMNLKNAAPSWVFQYGYETGACVYAVVPLSSFERIEDNSFIGNESLVSKVADPVASLSLFGFGDDTATYRKLHESEVQGLESFSVNIFNELVNKDTENTTEQVSEVRNLVDKMIGQEALSLTDNPDILQVPEKAKKVSNKRIKEKLLHKYKKPHEEAVVVIPKKGEGDNVVANPILMRLPPESVTVIHTPGDPNDHQGYLVLLDMMGNPINAALREEDIVHRPSNYNNNQGNIFAQVYNAYGLSSGSHGYVNPNTMQQLYSEVVTKHLAKRLDKAGLSGVEISNSDSVLRCMFSRFLQEKRTRVLFLPKELVTYMTNEKDQNGYGISKLDSIKFSLGMRMAVQVSRVLAAIKAAMDKRTINIKFTDNLLESPEAVFQAVIREYVNKQTMTFSIDPNQIQNQIVDKSVSIKGTDIPGMEAFDITNDPDTRSGSFDFDPSLTADIDKDIVNGLDVPASAVNSLSEDEYARSIVTTNLFFASLVSIEQENTIYNISDLLKKYARYSEEFYNGIYEKIPSLKKKPKDGDVNDNAQSSKDEFNIPNDLTIEDIIDSMKITLPHPNIAPSKAQFEALNAMVSSITETVSALIPDDLSGGDDNLSPALRLIRAKYTSMNIRNYLDTSGMTNIDIPTNNFTEIMNDINVLTEGLQNIQALLKEKKDLVTPKEESTPEGYQ